MDIFFSQDFNFSTNTYILILLVIFIVVSFIAYMYYVINLEYEKLAMNEKYPVVSSVRYNAKIVSRSNITQYINNGMECSITYPYTATVIKCYAILEFIDYDTGEKNTLTLSNISYHDYDKIKEDMIIPIRKVVYNKKSRNVTVFESDVLEMLPLYVDECKVDTKVVYKNNFYMVSLGGLSIFIIFVLIMLGFLLWIINI